MIIYLDQCYRDKRLSAIKISDKFLPVISVEESFVRDRLERFFFSFFKRENFESNENLFAEKINYDISR